MEDITMGMGGASEGNNNEQPSHNNDSLVAPMVGSVFEPQPYNDVMTIGHVGDSSSNGVTDSYLNCANVASYLASNDNDPFNKGNSIPNEHHQLAKLTFGPNKVDPHMMDPKRLKRLESNRLSVQKCRNKQKQIIPDLEKQVITVQNTVITLRKEVKSTVDHYQALRSENEELKQKREVQEKIKTVVNAEIEKHDAEVKVLREIQKKQLEEQFRAPMFDCNADSQFMSSCPSSDPVVPENDEETPEMMIDLPPNQDN